MSHIRVGKVNFRVELILVLGYPVVDRSSVCIETPEINNQS
jgi:hypothetical protein